MEDKNNPPKLRKRKFKTAKPVFSVQSADTGKIPIDEDILLEIGKFADDAGIDVYVVGGFVRDYFLGRPRTDIDCTIVGDAVEFAKKLAEKFNTKAVVYERFRTALVPIGKYHCEFVGTRKEEYLEDSRKPIVSEGTLEDDLKRRDFTVNALAASLNPAKAGEIIDLFGGLEDMKKKILRTPLEPGVTFSDDPLRMMRAARFSAQLGFEIDSECLYQVEKMAHRISIISQERITDEFLKIIDSPKPSIGLAVLYKTGLLKKIFPEVNNLAGVDIVKGENVTFAHKDVFWHSLKVLDNAAAKTDKRWLRFAALVHDIAKPVTKRFNDSTGWTFHGHEEIGARMMPKIFRKMKFPLEPLEYVQKLVRLHQRPMSLVDEEVTDSAIRRLAVQAGDALEDLFILVRADITTKNPNLSEKYRQNYESVFNKVIEVQEKDKLREFQSPVRGEEIMEVCGLEPCRAIGVIKTNIEEAILEGIIPNEYEPARDYFLENKDEWLGNMEKRFIKKINS
jgi:poly(A) polymerase